MAQTEEWLQNLKEKIVDEKDATNFDDIIKCYQNGLLRAGYLMAWLMLIESLKRKVIELEAKESRGQELLYEIANYNSNV